jgi:2-hydroxy-6-oxonona-2,4-dienedioate hydrolase
MTPALTEQETSRYITTRDWKIHYNEAGEGLPVLLLHGSGPGASGWSNFSPNISVLAENFRVLAVDMPGWGKSDPCTAETINHADAALQLLDALGIEKAAFVGNSMGGVTALRFATVHPDRISHLVTMGPASGRSPKLFSPGDGPSEGIKVLFDGYRDPSSATMRRLVEIMTFDPAFATDDLAQQRADGAHANPEHLANFMDMVPKGGPVQQWFTLDELTRVETPTLLIHGRDDRVVPYEHSLHLVAHVPNSRLVLFNRCGHWAQLEHAAEFNHLVTGFIQKN